MRNPFKKQPEKQETKIEPRLKFRDGRETYEPGRVYKVPLARAYYFEANGWLVGSVANPPERVTLDIQNSVLGQKSRIVDG